MQPEPARVEPPHVVVVAEANRFHVKSNLPNDIVIYGFLMKGLEAIMLRSLQSQKEPGPMIQVANLRFGENGGPP